MNITQKTISTVSGVGSAVTRLEGLIFGILLEYAETAPATTTVTIKELEGAKRQIIEVAENNADYHFVPQIPAVTTANAPLGNTSIIPVTGERLSIVVTGGGTVADAVTVWIWSE